MYGCKAKALEQSIKKRDAKLAKDRAARKAAKEKAKADASIELGGDSPTADESSSSLDSSQRSLTGSGRRFFQKVSSFVETVSDNRAEAAEAAAAQKKAAAKASSSSPKSVPWGITYGAMNQTLEKKILSDQAKKAARQAAREAELLEALHLQQEAAAARAAEKKTETAKEVALKEFIASNSTWFETLGGVPSVRAVVDAFYESLESDPELELFFQPGNMALGKLNQMKFLRMAYTDIPGDEEEQQQQQLNAVVYQYIVDKLLGPFAKKKMQVLHFDCIYKHLFEILNEMGFDQDTVSIARTNVIALRHFFIQSVAVYG